MHFAKKTIVKRGEGCSTDLSDALKLKRFVKIGRIALTFNQSRVDPQVANEWIRARWERVT